jgi:hypothetical protein
VAVLKKFGDDEAGNQAALVAYYAFLHLGAQVTLYAAEINVVVNRRLWPRSLLEPTLRADEHALTRLAKIEERVPAERIEVEFDRPTGSRSDRISWRASPSPPERQNEPETAEP